MEVPPGEIRLRLHFEIRHPVELVDLTLAFSSIARQHRRFLRRRMRLAHKPITDDDVGLHITEIKTSSIDALPSGGSEMSGSVFSLSDYINIFIDHTNYWKEAIEYFKGVGDKPADFTQKDREDIADVCGLVAKNEGGKLSLETAEYAKDDRRTRLRVTFNQRDCIEAQKGAIREKQLLTAAGNADYSAVLMRWHQTDIGKPKTEGRTGDRAIIDVIAQNKDYPIYFASAMDEQKAQMLDDPCKKLRVYPLDASVREKRRFWSMGWCG